MDGMMITEDSRISKLDNGTSRADVLCQEDAERFGLWGHYSAVLSTKQRLLQNITSEKYRHLPIVNTKVSIIIAIFIILMLYMYIYFVF